MLLTNRAFLDTCGLGAHLQFLTSELCYELLKPLANVQRVELEARENYVVICHELETKPHVWTDASGLPEAHDRRLILRRKADVMVQASLHPLGDDSDAEDFLSDAIMDMAAPSGGTLEEMLTEILEGDEEDMGGLLGHEELGDVAPTEDDLFGDEEDVELPKHEEPPALNAIQEALLACGLSDGARGELIME